MISDDLGEHILFSLHRKGYYGAKHTPISHLCKRLPHYSCKDIKHKIKELIHKGYLAPYPTKHGLDVHINIHRSHEVKEIIEPLEEELEGFLN